LNQIRRNLSCREAPASFFSDHAFILSPRVGVSPPRPSRSAAASH